MLVDKSATFSAFLDSVASLDEGIHGERVGYREATGWRLLCLAGLEIKLACLKRRETPLALLNAPGTFLDLEQLSLFISTTSCTWALRVLPTLESVWRAAWRA